MPLWARGRAPPPPPTSWQRSDRRFLRGTASRLPTFRERGGPGVRFRQSESSAAEVWGLFLAFHRNLRAIFQSAWLVPGALKNGWGAGIRTPILRSRAACPAIGRHPSRTPYRDRHYSNGSATVNISFQRLMATAASGAAAATGAEAGTTAAACVDLATIPTMGALRPTKSSRYYGTGAWLPPSMTTRKDFRDAEESEAMPVLRRPLDSFVGLIRSG